MKNQVSSDDTHPIKNCKTVFKKSIIDGADKVRNLSFTKTVNKNRLSFIKESQRLKKATHRWC